MHILGHVRELIRGRYERYRELCNGALVDCLPVEVVVPGDVRLLDSLHHERDDQVVVRLLLPLQPPDQAENGHHLRREALQYVLEVGGVLLPVHLVLVARRPRQLPEAHLEQCVEPAEEVVAPPELAPRVRVQRCVLQRADEARTRPRRYLLARRAVDVRAAQPKVHERNRVRAARAYEEVRWFDVAVQIAGAVQALDRAHHFDPNAQHRRNGEGFAREKPPHSCERRTAPLHHKEAVLRRLPVADERREEVGVERPVYVDFALKRLLLH